MSAQLHYNTTLSHVILYVGYPYYATYYDLVSSMVHGDIECNKGQHLTCDRVYNTHCLPETL